MHIQLSSWSRNVNFGLGLHVRHYFVFASRAGIDKTVQMVRLVSLSAFALPICDKYQGSSLIRGHSVCYHDKILSVVHLNICSRLKKQMIFLRQKDLVGLRVKIKFLYFRKCLLWVVRYFKCSDCFQHS